MKAVFRVVTLHRDTGAENWVRVEAASADDARAKVIALGEIVGEVQLAEVLDDGGESRHVPGVVVCPICGGIRWKGGRSVWLWIGVVLLFPIGLLLLFVKPTFRCLQCGYTFRRYTPPVDPDAGEREHSAFYYVVYWLLAVVAIFGGLLVIGLLFGCNTG